MSEIDLNSGQLLRESEFEDTLSSTTTATVAAVISSALETADGVPEDEQEESSNFFHVISTEDATTKSSIEDKLFLSNNNNLLNLDKDSKGSLVRTPTSEYRLFEESPKKPFEGGIFGIAGNAPVLKEDCGGHFGILSPERNDADGNYVCGIHDVSSACSPFFSSKSTPMAENKETSDYFSVSSSGEKTIRDKSDNREEKERSTIDEAISSNSVLCTFKSSTNKIELPESPSINVGGRVISAKDHHHHHHHHHRNKDSKIPVGIAVAWQRLVTSTLTNPTTSSVMTTKAESGTSVSTQKHHHHQASKSQNFESLSGIQNPVRPSSASPLLNKTTKMSSSMKQSSPISSSGNNNCNFNYANGNSDKTPGGLPLGRENNGNANVNLANRPLSACGDAIGSLVPFCPSSPLTPSASPLSRPMPSSSVPPNLGYPSGSTLHHHSQYPQSPYHRTPSYMEYPYGMSGGSPNGSRTFAIPSPLTSPHHPSYLPNVHQYWGGLGVAGMENPAVPILPTGIPNSSGASDYLQLSMQQQIHLHQQHLLANSRQNSLSLSPSPSPLTSSYNPYLSFMYPNPQEGASMPSKNPYFDHYFHQQQSELLRQRQQQQQQQQQQLLRNPTFPREQQEHQHHENTGISISSENNSNNNSSESGNNMSTASNITGSSSSSVGGYDLLANNNYSSNQDRTIPMVAANPRSNIPLLSRSPTGGIRTPTPTPTATATSAEALATTSTITEAAHAVIVPSTSISTDCRTSITTTTQQQPSSLQQNSQSGTSSCIGSTSATELSYSSASSPSPSFLLIHQQQHPHLFTSSSAALSPKSLTSSTPSPVTVHDFNSGLNVVIGSSNSSGTTNLTTSTSSSAMLTSRKCTTPSPISLTPRPLLSPFGSPFSPSPTPSGSHNINNNNNNNNGSIRDLLWKDEMSASKMKSSPASSGGMEGEEHERQGDTCGEETTQVNTPTTSPLLQRRTKQLSVPTPLSSPSSQKHDFKRLESLIERRDSESISPLVLIPQPSPANSTSSVVDSDESRVLLLQGECEEAERKIIPAFHIPKIEEHEKKSGKANEKLDRKKEGNGRDTSSSEATLTAPGNDSFKVKPPLLQTNHLERNDAKLSLVKAEKVLIKSEETACVKVEMEANKTDTIICCDANNTKSTMVVKVASKNQHGGDQSGESPTTALADNETDNMDVPELTLPFSSNTNKDSYFNMNSASLKSFKNKNCKNQTAKDDASFATEYSSANEDDDDHHLALPTATTLTPKKTKTSTKTKPEVPSFKVKPKKKTNISGRKTTKSAESQSNPNKDRIMKTVAKSEETKSSKSTKLFSEEKKKPKRKGKISLNSNELKETPQKPIVAGKAYPVVKVNKKKGKELGSTLPTTTRVGATKVVKNSNRGRKKLEPNKTEFGKEGSFKKEKKEKVTRKRKNAEKDKLGNTTTPKKKLMTNHANPMHQFASADAGISKTVIASQVFNATSEYHGSSVSDDNISSLNSSSSINYNNIGDHNGSLTIDTSPLTPAVFSPQQQHQPVAVFLQSSNFTTPSAPLPIPCPSQVTFLISSGTPASASSQGSTGATLKIPAYIPRSTNMMGSDSSGKITQPHFSSLTADDIVGDGESYSGPATLTLHRDVDSIPQQSFYQAQQQQQPPPAITIQYHHSAPATPLMMEAASPYANIKPEENSLDLLATVAQEFGSREDLGKRLSLDGSCNNSCIGESPPMSPPKSPNFPPVILKYQYQKPNIPLENGINNNNMNAVKSTRSPLNITTTTITTTATSEKPAPKKKLSKAEQKDQKLLSAPKKPKKAKEKTTNSIEKKQVKAGKKQKRCVSDSAASHHPPPVVLLKIPQIQRPMLSPKAKKRKEKAATNNNNNKSIEMTKNVSKALKSVNKEQQQQQKAEKKLRRAEKKASEKADQRKKMKKSIKTLALPEPIGKVRKNANKKEEKVGKNIAKKLSKKIKLTTNTSPSKDLPSDTGIVGDILSPSKTPKSPGGSSTYFFSPTERISAFAKQVIAQRDGSTTSPILRTESPDTNAKFSQVAPTDDKSELQQQQKVFVDNSDKGKSLGSPTIIMPQLTPFDVEPSSQNSDFVPKVTATTMTRFPCSTPPSLLPSVSNDKSKMTELDHSEFEASEQDKKTDFNLHDRSPNNICSDSSDAFSFKSDSVSTRISEMSKTKNKQQKRRKKRENADEVEFSQGGKIKKRKQELLTSNTDIKRYKPKKSAEKSKKGSVSEVVLSQSPNIPRITITSTTTTEEGETTSTQYVLPSSTSVSFTPLTPPPTAKVPPEEEGSDNGTFSQQLEVTRASTPSSSRHSSPSSNHTNDEDVDVETENENDFNNVWVSDPMFAVSAVKLSNSCLPSDASSIGGDDNSFVDLTDFEESNKNDPDKINDTLMMEKPPKLSNQIDKNDISSGQDHFLEVKTQLKGFVQYKPKQPKGSKKIHRSKPLLLKGDSVSRSQSATDDDEDDDHNEDVQVEDEDFALDMEVAKITTQSVPKGKAKKNCNDDRNSSTATSASSTRKKPTINRNSFSYLNNSSSKKHNSPSTPLSTKEIMAKVFTRKVSPELGEKKRKHSKRPYSTKKRHFSGTETEADDEDEDADYEEELLDIPPPCSKSSGNNNIAQISMNAAATAIVIKNASSIQGTPTTSTNSTSPAAKKSPKKRTARSSTTSSSASTKSNSRGNRGQLLSGPTVPSCSTSVSAATKDNEMVSSGKVELDSVEDLVDEMRILTEIQGLFYTGRLNALQPPDVYGVTLDNERGAPPHLIFSAEEVLEKCLRENKPQVMTSGLRICAYWSPQYSGLYPGRVSSDFNPKYDPEKDLIPIEFDDGDTGMIKLKEIRLLSVNHPIREYDPNPLLTLEKKHRKRRHSSATGTSGGCTGDHEEPDCGESYCAKIEKLKEEEEEEDDGDNNSPPHSSKMMYWTWSGLGYKRPKSKKNRNKEFFHGIQRGNEVINVGDAALFISTGNERPFIGRVERFWECKGKKMVNVRWFYHPEEVKASAKRLSNLKYPGALFESPHIDENDVQTIAKKCDVLPFTEFKERMSSSSSGSLRVKLSAKSSSKKPRDMYYVAGYYDPYTYNLKLKDLK